MGPRTAAPHDRYLTGRALEILNALPREVDFVFPGERKGAAISNMAMAQLLKRIILVLRSAGSQPNFPASFPLGLYRNSHFLVRNPGPHFRVRKFCRTNNGHLEVHSSLLSVVLHDQEGCRQRRIICQYGGCLRAAAMAFDGSLSLHPQRAPQNPSQQDKGWTPHAYYSQQKYLHGSAHFQHS